LLKKSYQEIICAKVGHKGKGAQGRKNSVKDVKKRDVTFGKHQMVGAERYSAKGETTNGGEASKGQIQRVWGSWDPQTLNNLILPNIEKKGNQGEFPSSLGPER